MPDSTDFNYEEAIHGVLETKTALGRAQADMLRLEKILSEHPASFAPLAEPAFRLRDRLIEDLGTLEARLAQADTAAVSGEPPPRLGQRANEAEALGVSQGDVRALGGQ